jgi:gluconokinase
MADGFGREVAFPGDRQSVCLGAAILGMRALGWIDSLAGSAELVHVRERHLPDEGSRGLYAELRDDFRRLATLLAPQEETTDVSGS